MVDMQGRRDNMSEGKGAWDMNVIRDRPRPKCGRIDLITFSPVSWFHPRVATDLGGLGSRTLGDLGRKVDLAVKVDLGRK